VVAEVVSGNDVVAAVEAGVVVLGPSVVTGVVVASVVTVVSGVLV